MFEIILGLLMIKSTSTSEKGMTAYDIKKTIQNGIENGMNQISSDSMGNIHASIKKLLSNGYLIFEEFVDNGKYKKTYYITDDGRKYFESWINSSFESTKKRNPELKKIYFMAFSDKEDRKLRVQEYIDVLIIEKNKLERLSDYYSFLLKDFSDAQKEIGSFQFEIVQYGLGMIKFEIEWYSNFIKRL